MKFKQVNNEEQLQPIVISGLVYLRMSGIPCALSHSTYLSVCQEDGALCLETIFIICLVLCGSGCRCRNGILKDASHNKFYCRN